MESWSWLERMDAQRWNYGIACCLVTAKQILTNGGVETLVT